jgi:hypothetical protein
MALLEDKDNMGCLVKMDEGHESADRIQLAQNMEAYMEMVTNGEILIN